MIWVGGTYPHEQQWRAEGFLWNVANSECQFLGNHPPASLVGEILACEAQEGMTDANSGRKERSDSTPEHSELSQKLRAMDDSISDKVRGTLFIPLRMEVLIGGPSSPGGPRRYEWKQTYNDCGWSAARSILPFSPAASTSGPQLQFTQLRSITVALTGTHCSGKSTIGRKLSEVMNWEFHRELGEILRKNIPESGHREGYSTNANDELGWDDRIHLEEIRRDQETPLDSSRVVETW